MEEFEAKLAAASDSPVLPSGTAPLALHNGPMEEPEAHVFVNFANANFGYGRYLSRSRASPRRYAIRTLNSACLSP
jgi:hypothetical protein